MEERLALSNIGLSLSLSLLLFPRMSCVVVVVGAPDSIVYTYDGSCSYTIYRPIRSRREKEEKPPARITSARKRADGHTAASTFSSLSFEQLFSLLLLFSDTTRTFLSSFFLFPDSLRRRRIINMLYILFFFFHKQS